MAFGRKSKGGPFERSPFLRIFPTQIGPGCCYCFRLVASLLLKEGPSAFCSVRPFFFLCCGRSRSKAGPDVREAGKKVSKKHETLLTALGDCLKRFLLLRSLRVFAQVAGFLMNDSIEYFLHLVGPPCPLSTGAMPTPIIRILLFFSVQRQMALARSFIKILSGWEDRESRQCHQNTIGGRGFFFSVPGGNRSAASCLCAVLRRALYHYATRSPTV